MYVTTKTPVQKRVSDIDFFHHVNNVSQQMYFDLGKVDYYSRVIGEDALYGRLRIITASTSISFIRQTFMEDDVYVTTTTERLGNKSITLFQQLICRRPDGTEEVRSECRAVMVAFDFDLQAAVPVPDAWREKLTAEE